MAGPCPNGQPTILLHKEARCRDKERCTGQGCRVRRAERVSRLANALGTAGHGT